MHKWIPPREKCAGIRVITMYDYCGKVCCHPGGVGTTHPPTHHLGAPRGFKLKKKNPWLPNIEKRKEKESMVPFAATIVHIVWQMSEALNLSVHSIDNIVRKNSNLL